MTATRKSTTRKAPTAAQVEARDAKVQALLEQMQAGVAAIRTSEEWIGWLRQMARFHRYSFRNVMLATLQAQARGFQLTQIAGFNAWRDDFKRSVRKGEKGLSILRPVIVKLREGDKGFGVPGVSQTKCVGFAPTAVFDVSQTDGEPLATRPAVEYPEGEVPEGAWDRLAAFAASKGYPVSIEAMNGPDGFTTKTGPGGQRIAIAAHLDTDARRFTTLAHEVAHALLHMAEDYNYGAHRGVAETEAESAAFVVGTALGVQMNTESFHYVAGWNADPAAVITAGSRIMQAAKQMLEALEAKAEVLEPVA